MTKKITKKTIKQMQYLGYTGENPTIDEAVRWLREEKGHHVMPIPYRVGQWHVVNVGIRKGHVEDCKLFSFSDHTIYGSYDEAAVDEMAFVVNALYRAEKMIEKHYNDKEFLEKVKSDARKMGLEK